MTKMRIAVIGGGIVGLTAGYELAKRGHEVTVFEKDKILGGLASSVEIEGTRIDSFYHHIFKSDNYAIELIKELGLVNDLKWHKSSLAIYDDEKIQPFVTPIDLLKFKGLSLMDKLRLGLMSIYLTKTNNWKKFEKVNAEKWLINFCGKKAYEKIWLPLLKGKYHKFSKNISMVWMWGRIYIRGRSKDKDGEKLGYLRGSFDRVNIKLAEGIKKHGGQVKNGILIDKIRQKGEKFEIDGQMFDKCLCALDNKTMVKIMPKNSASRNYRERLTKINYLGAMNIVFSSDQNLSDYYWHNVNDKNFPFLVFVEHTNFAGSEDYKNKHVYYAGTYIPVDHRLFLMSDNEIKKLFFEKIGEMFPKFDKSKVRQIKIVRYKNAQHVPLVGYQKYIPKIKTPIENLYLVNFSQIYPFDRSINFAIKQAQEVVENIVE